MKFSEMFPSNYLSQDDLAEPKTLTIAGVSMEELRRPGGGKAIKPVLYFKGGKPLVLNKTNGGVLAKAFGRETDAWAGKAIEAYFDATVKMGGDVVGGVRLRVPAGAAASGTSNGKARPRQTPLEAHNQIMDAYSNAASEQRLNEWVAWAAKWTTFSADQRKAQAEAHDKALERLGLVEPAGVDEEPGINGKDFNIYDKDIPF